MAQPLSPWLSKALAILASGPQPRETIIREISPLVPPGRAYRANVRTVERQKAEDPARRLSTRQRPAGDAYAVEMGQRQIVGAALRNAVATGRLIQYADAEGATWLTLPDWRDPVADAAARVAKYLDVRLPMRGLDPEAIHVIGDETGAGYTLAVADLRLLIERATR